MASNYITITILLLALHKISSSPAKTYARPVHEVINEQSRSDDKPKPSPGILPYGNPLAGNSQQNAKLHAQNQQAMFNAERIRQHRAQLQRWTKAPIKMDSYMKAYQDSQESHQLALEQQQSKRDKKHVSQSKPRNPSPTTLPPPAPKRHTLRIVKSFRHPDVTQFTKNDAVDKNRNHRSYGSSHHQYLQSKRYQTVFVSPGPTYDQGVTIKPNGNIGLSYNQPETTTPLYTSAIASTEKYVYPKHYNQMQNYKSAQDIAALNSLLKKTPQEQVNEFSALLHADQGQETVKDDELNTPVDLFFYLKDQPTHPQNFQHEFSQIPYTSYKHEFKAPKDHIPITEDVDDIEDPNKRPKMVYGYQSAEMEKTTTKNNNYYKVEVASQPISGQKQQIQYVDDHHPSFQALHYGHTYYQSPAESDESERYLHHNAIHTGIQHLTEDGSGVSAYGDENLHYAANYEFGYRVRDHNSGNDFGHQEAKNGEKTKGQYHVLLPDGRMQQVKYSAGPEGFHADISYDHLSKK